MSVVTFAARATTDIGHFADGASPRDVTVLMDGTRAGRANLISRSSKKGKPMARLMVVAAGMVLLAGCSAPPPQEAPQVQMPDRAAAADLGVAGTGFGDPLPGLGAVELGRFDVGKTEFTAPEEPA